MFPFRPPIKPSKVCKVIIPIIWIVAICLHGSYFYTARLLRQDNKLYCTFSWVPEFDEQRTQERYFVVVSVCLIFLPLCVILTLYALILKELKKGQPLENGASAVRRQRQREDTAIEKRIVTIVFLFVLCITPLLYYFVWDWHLSCTMNKLFSAAKFTFYSNASLNPCVYIILSERYRQGLKSLTSCLHTSRVKTNNIELNVL